MFTITSIYGMCVAVRFLFRLPKSVKIAMLLYETRCKLFFVIPEAFIYERKFW